MMICQEDKPESLKYPLASLGADSEVFYSSFLENVEEFRRIDALPTNMYFGDEITIDDLKSHNASWHKSCHLKYSTSKLRRATHKKKSTVEDPGQTSGKRQAMDATNCMFCEKGFDEGDLHQALTLDANVHIREMLTELQDTQLLAKIGTDDLIAQEVKYHLKCLTKLRNRFRSYKRKSQTQQQEVIDGMMNESRVFVELINYTETSVDSGMLLFRLADLHTLYMNHRSDLASERLSIRPD